jgi:hypothetical protein
MAKRSTPQNPLTPTSLIGLEGGRDRADRRHRRRRMKERAYSSVVIAILMGVVTGAGYIGYTIYDEQRADEQVERDRRQAELDAERVGVTGSDILQELEETPRWNGPGAPAFGVGEDEVDPAGEITIIEP